MVFNDEAHHCYLDRYDNPEDEGITDKDLTGDDKAEARQNTEAARLWFNGLRAINERLGVKAVYDLSATPSFLSGSGYREGTLFPWVVSDFGLVEAIESGIVKIPRVPVDDNATTPDVRFLNLWPGIKDGLPKKSRKEGTVTPDQMPGLLEGALNALYDSYAKAFAAWENSDAKKYGEPAPVFIVVCNNTTVSKMVYDYIAGWEKPLSDYQAVWVPGKLPLFSNVDHGKPIARPRTILVDSLQFESGEGLSPEFKKIAATEIEEFRAEYARRVPGRKAEDVDDGQIMREVMNTVGKAGKLGEPVRCVVSVSMLTEGWDANTVTHILGVRAFGTQLLCEQVVGRGLRRRSYEPDENGLFTPEYADVYGVPFQFMPTVGKDGNRTIKPTRSVHALPERKEAEISFPRVAGYRLEIRDPELFEDFTERSRLTLDTKDIPTQTVVSGLIGVSEKHTLDDLRAKRDQEIAYVARAPDHDLVRRRPRPAPVVLPAGAADHQAVDGRVRHLPRRHVPRPAAAGRERRRGRPPHPARVHRLAGGQQVRGGRTALPAGRPDRVDRRRGLHHHQRGLPDRGEVPRELRGPRRDRRQPVGEGRRGDPRDAAQRGRLREERPARVHDPVHDAGAQPRVHSRLPRPAQAPR